MMNAYDYNGFDALDREDYDALMEELADDNAREYFEKEIEKDAAGFEMPRPRYQVIVSWNDNSCKTESTNDISAAMGAAEIFMADPDVFHIVIYDWKRQKDMLDWEP